MMIIYKLNNLTQLTTVHRDHNYTKCIMIKHYSQQVKTVFIYSMKKKIYLKNESILVCCLFR